MDRVAADCRNLLQGGSLSIHHGELKAAVAVMMGQPQASEAEVDAMMRRAARKTLSKLMEIPRFLVDRPAAELIKTMLEQPGRLLASARHLFAPATDAWIEVDAHDCRIGLFLQCLEGTLTKGGGSIYIAADAEARTIAVPVDWDLGSPRSIMDWLGGNRAFLERIIAIQAGRRVSVDIELAGLLLLGVLAVLSTPRIWHRREINRDKINKHRVARGKWPLLAYSEVLISVSQEHPSTVTPADGSGRPRALHFVRAHLRVRSTGMVEVVSPHWRGDAQLGVKRPGYRLTL